MKTKLELLEPSPLTDAALTNAWQREAQAEQRWGDTETYQQARQRSRQWTPAQLATIQQRWQGLEETMGAHLRAGKPVDDAEVQATAAAWVEHLRSFYSPSAELVAGLADLYVQDPEFFARYEAVQAGLPGYLQQVLSWHAIEKM